MIALANLFAPLALEGHWADIRAILVVLTGVLVLIGSIYMLLWSNFGARLAYLILMVSLSGFMIIMSLIWLVGAPGTAPGTGPRAGRPSDKLLVAVEPQWIPFLPTSEQGREFQREIDRFPADWDEPGEVATYPGNIDAQGEIDAIKGVVTEALARYAEQQGLEATQAEAWEFRIPGEEVLPGQEELSEAKALAFKQEGTPLLFGVTIPATDEHGEITVFAFRDKGRVFLYSLYFLVVSLLLFLVHLWLIARYERHEAAEEARLASA